MVTGAERRLTAVQIILLAAEDLMSSGATEFTEWDLTVASWNRNREKFGLRGYQNVYPDHKRVMMEIMGKKATNPVEQRWMEKVRPNTYRLTSVGRLEASRLKSAEAGSTASAQKVSSMRDLYDRVAVYAAHSAFLRWRDEPSEPEKWGDAASFLGVKSKEDPNEAAERLQAVWTATRAAIDFCMEKNLNALPQGTSRGSASIHMRELSEIIAFLQALKYRFPEHLDPSAGTGKRRLKPSRN